MKSEILSTLSEQFSLTAAADGSMCGKYSGFGFALREVTEKKCIIFSIWLRKSALAEKTPEAFLTDYQQLPENSFVKAVKENENEVLAVLFTGDDVPSAVNNINRFINEFTAYLNDSYFSSACAECTSSVGLEFGIPASGGNVKQYCKMCLQKQQDKAEALEAQKKLAETPSVQDINGGAEQPVPAANLNTGYVAPTPAANLNTGYVAPTPAANLNTGYVAPTSAENLNTGYVAPTPAANLNTGYVEPLSQENAAIAPISDNAAVAPISDAASLNTGYVPTVGSSNPPGYAPIENANDRFGGYQYRPTRIEKKANPLLGIVGAVLFSLIGCVIWILISQLDIVSYIGGIVMAVAIITGYRMLGKSFDMLGLVICFVIDFGMILLCTIFNQVIDIITAEDAAEVLSYMGYNGFFDLFFRFFEFIGDYDSLANLLGEKTLSSVFTHNIVISYVIGGIAYFAMAVPTYKKG